jgi:hypothetical protein
MLHLLSSYKGVQVVRGVSLAERGLPSRLFLTKWKWTEEYLH